MSVADGKTSQSSRMYFRTKDHKDAYFDEKFHGAMIYSDDDAVTHGIYWRKMFRDRYVIYLSGGNRQNGYFPLVYPKEKLLVDSTWYTSEKFAINNLCNMYAQNWWPDHLRITSTDRRVVKSYDNISLPFGQYGAWWAVKDGVLSEDNYSAWNAKDIYYLKVKESSDVHNHAYELDTCTKVIDHKSISRIFSNGFSYNVIIRYNDKTAWDLLNVNTGTLIENVYTPNNDYIVNESSGLQYANGKSFMVGYYGTGYSRTACLYEITDTSVIRHDIATFSDSSYPYIRYYDGYYYAYISVSLGIYSPNVLHLYKSSDLNSWSEISIPSSISIPALDQSENYIVNTINLISRWHLIQFFENSEPIFDTGDMFSGTNWGFENNDFLCVYLDNLTFQVNDNCFAYKQSWANSHYNPMGMWEHYYSI